MAMSHRAQAHSSSAPHPPARTWLSSVCVCGLDLNARLVVERREERAEQGQCSAGAVVRWPLGGASVREEITHRTGREKQPTLNPW